MRLHLSWSETRFDDGIRPPIDAATGRAMHFHLTDVKTVLLKMVTNSGPFLSETHNDIAFTTRNTRTSAGW